MAVLHPSLIVQRGIRCPRCGGTRYRVTHTRPARDRIRRYKVCLGCGRQSMTVEVTPLDQLARA